jgi:hypothetical protein
MRSIPGFLAAALLLGATRLACAQSEPGPPDGWLHLGLAAGYGFSVHFNRGRADERLALFAPSLGLRLSSRLDFVVEGRFEQDSAPKGYILGFLPLGARLSLGRRRTVPYVSIGAGFGWTNLVLLEEVDRRFNFLLQAGLGMRREFSKGQALTFEARLCHLSNAGTQRPNLGLNSLVLLTGFSFR